MDYLAISFTEALLKFFKDGGIFIYPLLACSIAGLAAIVFKFLSLSRARIVPGSLESILDNATELKQVTEEIEKYPSALSRLAAVAIKNKDKDATKFNQAVEAMAREEVVKMHAGIGLLDVVITIAPLLGLLGTASGLVTIFQGLGETTDYLAIARGIAEALSTTIFGLVIAVPCVIAHSYFMRRIEQLTARMESILTGFTSICANLK
jgi:biopolymer transport protein ExbB